MGGIGLVARAGAVIAAVAAFAPPAWAAPSPMGQAFDQGSGNGDGTFTLDDCLVYPSEDEDGQRICTGQVPSFDGTPLDVDLTLADLGARGSTRPLMVFLNGFGNNKREWMSISDEGDGSDKWHWNSHWFAERHGHYVLSYTPRGFDTDKGREQALCTPPRGAPVPASSYQPCTPGGSSDVKDDEESAIRLKHRDFEIKDTQWLTALAADLIPRADPNRVAVSGGSYGGGESWTLASQAEWTFPRKCSRPTPTQRPPECRSAATPTLDTLLDAPKLQVAVPKYGWTDTAYTLAPNGHPGPYPSRAQNCDVFQDSADDPCYSSSTGHPDDNDEGRGNPIGVVKQSFIDVLYPQGERRSNLPHYKSDETDAWYARARVAGEPYEDADPTIADARHGLTEERGAYYQDKQWKAQCGYDPATKRCGSGRKVAIFAIQGWTDDLIPALEVLRQFKYLKDLDRLWPVELELADVGHSRAQNRPETWHRLNNQAWQFLREQINRSHEQETTVSSQPTICDNDGSPGRPLPHDPASRLTDRTPEQLSNGKVSITYQGPGALTSADPDPNGAAADPVFPGFIPDTIFPGGDCRVPAGLSPYTAVSAPLPSEHWYVGLGSVTIPYTFTGETGQIDARVWEVTPTGPQLLMTRGTYRIKLPEAATVSGTLQIPLFGNQYKLRKGHSIRLDLTQNDSPFLRQSTVASTIEFGNPTLTLPTRDSGTADLGGQRTNP